ncbi:NlpC/P60 family protein [Dactylosporangium sp. CS-047395]|uniref:C40 family peptidase n=1 Tax=Dactylosporangium sp. CS-047395 TaxID=3239936 RepID=UPI003D8DF0F9
MTHAVRIPLATLWSDPSHRTAANVVTQALLGDPVEIQEERADGWARVTLPDQDGDGGWLPLAQLAPLGDDGGPVSIVDALGTDLRDEPGGTLAMPGVPLGTRLVAAGSPRDGWLPVRVPGAGAPLWVSQADVRTDPADPVATARRLLGVVYVWGGLSPGGIDCSGLVHLAWRCAGMRLPREARDQAAAAESLAPGEERAGDLYFFALPGARIHHVGIVVEPGVMLHASGEARIVIEEPVPPDLAVILTGAGRPKATA